MTKKLGIFLLLARRYIFLWFLSGQEGTIFARCALREAQSGQNYLSKLSLENDSFCGLVWEVILAVILIIKKFLLRIYMCIGKDSATIGHFLCRKNVSETWLTHINPVLFMKLEGFRILKQHLFFW